jgi:hypothetical protein
VIRDPIHRLRAVVPLICLGLVLGACAGGSTTPSVRPVGPVEATPAATAANRPITEADNGRSVTVMVGSEVTLQLGNTYWQVQDSSNPAVLALVSAPTASGAGMTACVPGAGCGRVTAVFRAVAPGRATITASRTTCGEALLCTGSAGAYAVTIVVSG